MEITPQDLGEKWRRELLKRRAVQRIRHRMGYVGANGDISFATNPNRKRHRMARFWIKSANLPEKDAIEIVPLLTYENTGVSIWRNIVSRLSYMSAIWFSFILLVSMTNMTFSLDGRAIETGDVVSGVTIISLAAWALWVLHATLIAPRVSLRQINRDTVTQLEIESFLPVARGELDRMYLNTVLETMQQPLPVVAGQDIRKVLRSVGDRISSLPGLAVSANAADPVALRNAARLKRLQADAEPDYQVQESLSRQAESEEKQAQIVELAGTAVRQVQAHQSEAQMQLDTIRTVLQVYASSGKRSISEENAGIQDSVGQLTRDAVSVAGAKRELNDAELAALYGGVLPEPVMQRVGVPGASLPNPSVPGKWWQGKNGNDAP